MLLGWRPSLLGWRPFNVHLSPHLCRFFAHLLPSFLEAGQNLFFLIETCKPPTSRRPHLLGHSSTKVISSRPNRIASPFAKATCPAFEKLPSAEVRVRWNAIVRLFSAVFSVPANQAKTMLYQTKYLVKPAFVEGPPDLNLYIQ